MACAETASLQQGCQIQEIIRSRGVPMDTVLATASINFYAKSGDTESANKVHWPFPIRRLIAQQVFSALLKSNAEADVMAWNSIISAYSLQGAWSKSHQLFNFMLQYKVVPDSITFTHLLIAASHAGEVEAALKLYNEMQATHNIIPNITHNTIMVDVLSRSGQLNKAVEFIKANIPEPSI